MQNILNFIDSASGTVITVIAIFICAILAQTLLRVVLQRSTAFLTRKELFHNTDERQKRIKTINGIIGAIAAIAVWSIAILMILDKLGVPIGPLVASAGLIGAMIAFGSQSLVKDFVSGIFIIAENQYQIDDYVDIGPISGKVESVSVRTTSVRGDDGSIYYVPNGSITVTSNKSVGPIKEKLKIELAVETNLTEFAKRLAIIAENLQADESTKNLILEGPTIGAVTSVNKKTISINLEFKTSASKREKAASTIWRALANATKKNQIHLA